MQILSDLQESVCRPLSILYVLRFFECRLKVAVARLQESQSRHLMGPFRRIAARSER
jgi:hypothetical protein